MEAGTRVLIWYTEAKKAGQTKGTGEPVRGTVIGPAEFGWLKIQCDRGQGHGEVWCPPRFVEVTA